MKKFLALLLATVMVLACFAGLSSVVVAEDAPQDLVIDIATLEGAVEFAPAGYQGKVLQLFNYGNAVKLGDIDLSKYSSVVITYGCDGGAMLGDVGSKFVLTKNGPVANGDNTPKADAEVIADAALSNPTAGWAGGSRACTITFDTDYNGPVYLCHQMGDGNGAAVDSIKFIAKTEGGDEPQGPVLEEKPIALGKGGQGAPFSGEPTKAFGQRFTVAEGDVLTKINIYNVATYDDGNVNKWSFKVWQWNTDYATTVAGEPLFVKNGENHNNCVAFIVDFDAALAITGDIYYELEYLEGTKTFTGWTASDGPGEGVETYVGGTLATNGTYIANATVLGQPTPPDPKEESTECIFAYDFGFYSENITADMGIASPNETKVTELCKNGYVTLESLGGDPYFVFSKAPTAPSTQTDYVVIKYRTSTEGATGEIYTGRSDGLNWAAPMEKTHVDFTYTADGQWHTLVIDASAIWGGNKNASLTNFRFDFLKTKGSVDLAYIKFFATAEGAQACVDAETKTVEMKGEFIEGDDAIIMVGGNAYSADKWIKLSAAATTGATQTFEGDVSKFSICADEVRSTTAGTLNKFCTQEAHVYMGTVNGQIVDAEGAYDSISFRGWANPTGVEIAEFGYAINDQTPVFNANFAIDEPTLNEALNSAAARRFENIEIPTADLANGIYNIYLLVKDTNGTIYCMNNNFGGTIQYVKGNVAVSEYPYVDADGNGYTVRADGVIFDANGFDTGMHLFIDDNGTPYGAAHYFALTYQDPYEGAVEIDGVKYTYVTATPVTPKLDPVLPEDNSVALENMPGNVPQMSPDTLFTKLQGEDEKIIQDGGAHEYIANVLGGKIVDVDKNMEYFALRGWINGIDIAEFGYILNNNEPVFGSQPIHDDALVEILQSQQVRRYKIDISTADLADGVYNVYPVVKDTNGTVYYLNVWGSFKYVKGGSWKQVGYTDGTNTYVKAEDGSVTVNGEAGTGKLLITDNGGIYYDGVTALEGEKQVTINYDKVVGDPYIVDMTVNLGSMNSNNPDGTAGPALNSWPAAGYDAEGPGMYNIWGANGCIIFEKLPFADYNTVEFIVTTDGSVADEYPVGFVSDVAHCYGVAQTVGQYDYTADIAHGMAGAASTGSANISGRGNGGGWNACERLVRIDISDVDYAGAVAIACGSIAPNTMLIVECKFLNYEEVTSEAKGKYLYDTTLTYTVDPEIPVNPNELKPVYIVDGEALNPVGSMGIESEGYSYENGYITFTSTNADPNTTSNLVPAGTKIGRYMVVKYRSTNATTGEVFVGKSANALGAADNTNFRYTADGEWHTLVVDIGKVSDWPADGVVNHFRNDVLMVGDASIDIEYYAFFETEKEAKYYAEHDMHELPVAPVYYTITFMADGEVVKEITILEGTTSVKEPKVPAKEGFDGAWEEYTITGDKDQTINAVYTEKAPVDTDPVDPPQQDTDPVETDPTDPVETDPTTDPTTNAPAATDPATEPTDDGCGSVIGSASVAVLALVATFGAMVALKKKED